MQGNPGKILAAFADVLEKSYKVAVQYDLAADKLEKLGGIDLSSVKLAKDLDKRIQASKEWVKHTQTIGKLSKSYPDDVVQALKKSGLGQKSTLQQVKRSLSRRQHQFDLQQKIRDTDQSIIELIAKILVWSKKKWGQWTYDAKQKLLVFESDADKLQYNRWMQQLDVFARQQTSHQTQLLKLMQRQ